MHMQHYSKQMRSVRENGMSHQGWQWSKFHYDNATGYYKTLTATILTRVQCEMQEWVPSKPEELIQKLRFCEICIDLADKTLLALVL